MAAKKKGKSKKRKGPRQLIAMKSKETGHIIVKEKNTRNSPDKLILRLFDKLLGRHAEFVETKMK